MAIDIQDASPDQEEEEEEEEKPERKPRASKRISAQKKKKGNDKNIHCKFLLIHHRSKEETCKKEKQEVIGRSLWLCFAEEQKERETGI